MVASDLHEDASNVDPIRCQRRGDDLSTADGLGVLLARVGGRGVGTVGGACSVTQVQQYQAAMGLS